MVEPVDGLTRLDHAINAGLLLSWISLQGGDFVGLLAFDEMLRLYHQPRRGVSNFTRLQRATAGLDYRHTETNFTLGLAELSARLRRRALVILFSDFVDTVTAELMIEATQRLARLVDAAERRGMRMLAPHELNRLPQLYRSALSSLSVARAIALDRHLLLYLENLALRAYLAIYSPRTGLAEAGSHFLRAFPAA